MEEVYCWDQRGHELRSLTGIKSAARQAHKAKRKSSGRGPWARKAPWSALPGWGPFLAPGLRPPPLFPTFISPLLTVDVSSKDSVHRLI